MDSLAPSSRLLSWLRAPAAGRPRLRVEQLEDRTVPSTSISLSGVGWTPLGGTIVNGNPSQPTLPFAGRVNSVATLPNADSPGDPGAAAAAAVVFVGTPGGGLARSTDNGVTWTFLTDNLPDSVWGATTAIANSNRNLKVGAVGVSPLDANLVLVGLGERESTLGGGGTGLLRSLDGGNTFLPLNKGGNGATFFNGATFDKFVFHPANTRIIFALVNGGGGTAVYRSLDKGETWAAVSQSIPPANPFTPDIFTDFMIDPTDPSVAYIAASQAGNLQRGVFRSENFLNPAPVGDVAPGAQPVGGAISFTQVIGGSGSQVPGGSLVTVKLAFGLGTPTQPSRIYALSAAGGSSDQLFRSDDSGINFRRLDPLPTPNIAATNAGYNLEIIADPTTPNRIYVAGRGAGSVQVLLNADYDPTPGSGQTPQYVNLTLPSSLGTTTQVVRDLRFDNTGAKDPLTGRPINPGRLLVATDAGLFRFQAPNNGTTTVANYTGNSLDFVSLNGAPGPNALFIQEFFSTALAPQTDNTVIGGTFLNGQAIFQDAGPFPVGSPQYNSLYFWQATTGDPDARGNGGNTVINQLDPAIVYRVSNFTNGTADSVNPNPYFQRSTNGGQTFTTSTNGLVLTDPIADITPLTVDPSPQIGTNEAVLYTGTDLLYRSGNGGQAWATFGPENGRIPFVTDIPVSNRGPLPRVTATGVGRQNPGRIYVAVSDREGTIPGAPLPSRFGAALYRFQPGEVPALTQGVSPDAYLDVTPPGGQNPFVPPTPAPTTGPGATFPQSGLAPGVTIRQIVVDPLNSNTLVIITSSTGAGRVWRSTNAGNSWTDLTGNLPVAGGVGNGPGLSVFSITQDPNRTNTFADDQFYIGTTLGVWRLTNPTAAPAWERVGPIEGATTGAVTGTDAAPGALPNTRVFDVELNTTTGVLSAATLGRGTWQLQIRPFVRGTLYLDQNGDGDNANDTPTPIPAAVVLALDVTVPGVPTQFANTTTSAQGQYVFRSLPDATYQFDPANASRDLVDPATKYFITGPTVTETVNETKFLSGRDLFVFDRINISGVAYEDENGNGVRDAGEPGLAGFIVQLTDPSTGIPIAGPQATVTTDAAGAYTFVGVAPLRPNLVTPAGAPPDSNAQLTGGYRVVPAAVQPIFAGEPGFNLTQTPAVTGALTSNLNLTDALNEASTRIGVFQFGRLAGSVFEDFNGDGVRQGTEPGLAGVPVQLVNAGPDRTFGTPDDTSTATATAADGSYFFGDFVTGLFAGSYLIAVPPPAGFVQTTADFGAFTITSGATLPGLDVGEFAAASIAGALYEDVNANGVRDASENTFVPGLEVSLLDPRTNTVFASTVTDALGNYSFAGLFPLQRPGNAVPFRVRFTNPLGVYSQTSADGVVALTSGTAFTQVNVGVFRNTTVSGFAFDDTNGDGTRQLGEPGLANGSVSLLNSQTGAVVFTTTTDGAGNFVFTNVGAIPGPVAFRVGPPAVGFVQTTPNPPDFFVTSGVPVGGFVIGLFRNAAFTGIVYEDVNGNALPDANEPRLPGQFVQLVSAAGAVVQTAVTDANGGYTLTAGPGTFRTVHVVPAGFVQTNAAYPAVTTTSGRVVGGQNYGDFRLFATTGRVFNDLNGNGSGAGDPGLAGVLVQAVNTATGAVVTQALTDAAGNYSLPLLGPGTYRVQAVGGPNRVATTATSRTFTASSGQPQATDFGFFTQATVSGTVFEDVDRSGTVSGGDGFPSGITVQLLGAGNAVLATAVTGPNGAYSFPGLAPGTYRVQVKPPAGFTTVLNGTQTTTLVSGQTFTAAPIGVLRFGSVSGTVFLDPNRNTRRDAPERGVGGAVVGLFNGSTQVATQTTDGNGAYTFFNLDAGTYTVRVVGNPTGFQPTAGGSRTVTVAIGSITPSNAVTGIDFGLTGRDRYALAADGGGGPRVQVYDALSNSLLQDFFVYEQTFTGGVRVATGDVNGDGVDDLIVVPGKGGGPRVRVLDGVTQNPIYDYFAYEEKFRNGLFITSADVNGDGFSDLITGTEAGGGPRVTVFSGRTGTILADYFAFDENFRGGVRVGSGDVNGDGVAEILTSPGVGGGPTVVAWSLLSGQPSALVSFNAFDDNYTGGIYVAGSTTGPNGRSNIIVGSGQLQPAANVAVPVVRVFDTERFVATAEIEAFPGGVDPNGYRSEVRVASFDRTGDGVPDIAVANGPASYPRFRFLDGANRRPIGEETQPYEFGFTGGIFVG